MKVLITGAGGQLGKALEHTKPEGVETINLSHRELDIADSNAVAMAIAVHRPTHIINCAAYTNVEMAEANLDLAIQVNAMGPRNLAYAALNSGIRLLHVSTDYVFDGPAIRRSPYLPTERTNPCNMYGKSKLAGECAIETILPESLILRTSWVYSQWGTNFVKRLVDNLKLWDEIGVITDQFSCPTHAESVARVLWLATQRPDFKGIHHWTDAGVINRYEWAVAIMMEAQFHEIVSTGVVVKPMTSQEGGTRRPAYSALDSSSTKTQLGIEQTPWRDNLKKLFVEGLNESR